MPFDPTIAAIRYGMGLSPVVAAPVSVDDMMAMLTGPDVAAQAAPIPPYSQAYPSPLDYQNASRAVRDARGTDGEDAAEALRQQIREDGRTAVIDHIKADLVRATTTPDGFRERLVRFWADHFTVRATNGVNRHLVSAYIEEAIRPHVNGSFADMLVAVVGSPMMIVYLDQHQSMGPNSPTAQNRDRGLNENMAREMLELHTLGVGGAYGQDDVRELAELLTGVTFNVRRGAFFREQQAEPGSETVLGVTYGGGGESLDHVVAALRDLAAHPDTAQHLARKLAVHFIGPDPDASMIDAMARAYGAGDLMAMYDVMLRAEAAWAPSFEKVKQPFDFIASSMRALAVPVDTIMTATVQDVRRVIQRPMSVMGQVWQSPVGPDGWAEDADAWVTPQGMAGRITWAMQAPLEMLEALPDPRDFVFAALGPTPPENVLFAANAAETVSDGVGIVLASAAFQRR